MVTEPPNDLSALKIRSLCIKRYTNSGGASAVKEPGHFEIRKSSSQVTRSQGHSQDFLWVYTVTPFSLLVVALQIQAANAADCFTVKINQTKLSDMVTFLFSVHTITKQRNRQGGARAVDFPARSFDLAPPGVAPLLCTYSPLYFTLLYRSPRLCIFRTSISIWFNPSLTRRTANMNQPTENRPIFITCNSIKFGTCSCSDRYSSSSCKGTGLNFCSFALCL